VVASSDGAPVRPQADLSQSAQFQLARGAGRATPPADGLIAQDSSGKQVLAAYENVDLPGWTVLVEQPVDDAFAYLNGVMVRTGLLLTGGLLVALAASFLLARR